MIIVGSPDPHGPEGARSRDGYYAIDIALILGSLTSGVHQISARIDTELRQDELTQNNLIIIGGPVVNSITARLNDYLPIQFDKQDIYSTISKKRFDRDETGIIVKTPHPLNKSKMILVIAGKRIAGTRAALLALLKKLDQVAGRIEGKKDIVARIIQGIDQDSDGVIDDCRILE